MRMLADQAIPSDYEDDERRVFIEWHIEFFSETNELSNPERTNVDILWPKIDKYIELWNETKRIDPWAVGHEMADDLQASSVPPPSWPRNSKEPPKPKEPVDPYSSSLDDEVPF